MRLAGVQVAVAHHPGRGLAGAELEDEPAQGGNVYCPLGGKGGDECYAKSGERVLGFHFILLRDVCLARI